MREHPSQRLNPSTNRIEPIMTTINSVPSTGYEAIFQEEPKRLTSKEPSVSSRKQPSEIKNSPKAEISGEIHDWAKGQARKKRMTEASFLGEVLQKALIAEKSKHETKELTDRLKLLQKTDPIALRELLKDFDAN